MDNCSAIGYPIVEQVAAGTLLISKLPKYDGELHKTSIAKIVHRLKKLWCEGDRLGTEGRQERRRARVPYEQPPLSCRCSFCYTIYQRSSGVVRIDILVDGAFPPYWIEQDGSIIPMTKADVHTALRTFTKMLDTELTRQFCVAYERAEHGSAPDYWGFPPPMLDFKYSMGKYRETCAKHAALLSRDDLPTPSANDNTVAAIAATN